MTPKAQAPSRDVFRLFQAVPTRWLDNDVYGHVNNVVFYEYFDTVVNGFLMSATGQDIRQLPAIGLVVETGCRFFESISFPELLSIGMAVTHLGNSSIQYRLGVFREGAGHASAEGRFVHVYVDALTRKTTAIPLVVRDAVRPLVIGAA